jgi:hypothetical protein
LPRYPAELRHAVVTAILDDGMSARHVVDALGRGALPGFTSSWTITPTGCRLWAREERQRRSVTGEDRDHDVELARLERVLADTAWAATCGMARALQHQVASLSARQAAGEEVPARQLGELAVVARRIAQAAAACRRLPVSLEAAPVGSAGPDFFDRLAEED